jgi:hypothetical protein
MIIKTYPTPGFYATNAMIGKIDTSISRARDARLAEKHLSDCRQLLSEKMAPRANLGPNTRDGNADNNLKD